MSYSVKPGTWNIEQVALPIAQFPPRIEQIRPHSEQDPRNEQDGAMHWIKNLNFILNNLWFISTVLAAVVLVGLAYLVLATPIYQSNILIQVENSNTTATGAPKNIQGDLSSVFDIRIMTPSEIEVVRSRTVVQQAVENSKIYIQVRPKYFLSIGARIARANNQLSVPGLFGYGGYVWGAERAHVAEFNVPDKLEGIPFILRADGNGNFTVLQRSQDIEFRGMVGQTVRFQSSRGAIELHVEQLAANAGAEFKLTRYSIIESVENLQGALKVSEKTKQSGIIGITLEGADAVKTSAMLNEIGREYIRQNLSRKSEKAEKSLAFLDKKLPQLKKELEQSENLYREFRDKNGSVDLGEEAKALLQKSVWVESKIIDLHQRKTELLYRYADEHPLLESVNQQDRDLRRQRAAVNARIKELPWIEQELTRLSRNVKANTDLYTTLLGTASQLRMVTSSEVGNARLLDSAVVPTKPNKPKPALVMILATAAGLGLGVIGAFVRKHFRGRVDEPHEIEKLLGLHVCATIPHNTSPRSDIVVESFRRFRASLQFSMMESKNPVIMITGSSPDVGKSFVSANLAAVLASVGKKVLLIDADLRTGGLHRYFGLERKQGLAEIVSGDRKFEDVLHRSVAENLDFLTTGVLPRTPAELLAHESFSQFVALCLTRYDYVVIDTPPILAVSDALVVGAHAGAIFNIARAGVTTVSEIEETVRRLNQAGHIVTGIVFNDLKSRAAGGSYAPRYDESRFIAQSRSMSSTAASESSGLPHTGR